MLSATVLLSVITWLFVMMYPFSEITTPEPAQLDTYWKYPVDLNSVVISTTLSATVLTTSVTLVAAAEASVLTDLYITAGSF